MSIFKRIKNLWNASVNDLLDKMEDPEKAVNQIIRDMEEGILEMRRETASAIASHKMSESKLEKLVSEVRKWEDNAALAAKKGRDDLALEALRKKRDAQGRMELVEGQVREASGLVERLKMELAQLEEKIQQARAKRDTLVTKKRVAESKKRMMEAADRFQRNLAGAHRSADSIINGFDGFNKYEEKVERQLAEMEAYQELRDEDDKSDLAKKFEEMRGDSELENELAELKKRVGKE